MPAAKSCLGCGKAIPPTGSWCTTCATTSPDAPQRPATESGERLGNPGGHWSRDRVRGTQGSFRRDLIRKFGERCMALGAFPDLDPEGKPWEVPYSKWLQVFTDLEPGVRCTRTTGLQAHHGKARHWFDEKGAEHVSTDPDLLLCGPHHEALDPHARA
jgi:hypothetical protein